MVELVESLSVEVCVMKKPGCGKKMNSVLKYFFPVPMCISRPNQAKWLERRVVPLAMSALDSKTRVMSST